MFSSNLKEPFCIVGVETNNHNVEYAFLFSKEMSFKTMAEVQLVVSSKC